MINWRKPTEVPIKHEQIVVVSPQNEVFTGAFIDAIYKDHEAHYYLRINSSYRYYPVTTWCYEDELINTIPKEMM